MVHPLVSSWAALQLVDWFIVTHSDYIQVYVKVWIEKRLVGMCRLLLNFSGAQIFIVAEYPSRCTGIRP